jgi:hypothetical protein
MSSQNTFVYDLLARICDIERTISVVTPNALVFAVKFAYPRWFEPIGNNAFPGFFNRAVRTSSAHVGRPIRKDVYRVTTRLVLGPAFAGYKGEYEDYGNMLYTATINAFDAQQRLAAPLDPPNNLPLDFVESAIVQASDNGIEGKIYDQNPQTTYMVIDIPIDVTANVQVYRQS